MDFTSREIEIIQLVANGKTNREIATATGLTLHTVKWYLKQIYSKLHVGNRTEAAARARELAIIQDDALSADSHLIVNLPAPTIRLIGRKNELAHISDLLKDNRSRLITLHGAGGIGKTRLAIELGHLNHHQFRDGAAFVSLTALESAAAVGSAIGAALQIPYDKRRITTEEVIAHLRKRDLLLILDNFEHVIDAAPQITQILTAAPDVKILATSRVVLNIPGEHVIPLDGVAYPQSDHDDPSQFEAVQLFEQIATMNQPDYVVDAVERKAIGEICRIVEGMPLAIELAAAWTSVLSAAEIHEELEARLDMLAADIAGIPDRHRSIDAAITYSWDMQGDYLREVLMRLSLFRDGFTIRTARAVTGAHPDDILQLLNKAMIRRVSSGRFDMHPLISRYARNRLGHLPELLDDARMRHMIYFLNLTADACQTMYDTLSVHKLKELVPERSNVLKAWLRAMDTGQQRLLTGAAYLFMSIEAEVSWNEGRALYEFALNDRRVDLPELHGRLHLGLALIALRSGDIQVAIEHSNTVINDYASALPVPDILLAKITLANALLLNHRVDASGEILEEIASQIQQGTTLYLKADFAFVYSHYLLTIGNYEQAARLFEQLLPQLAADSWGRDILFFLYGEALLMAGSKQKAKSLLQHAANSKTPFPYYIANVGALYYLMRLENNNRPHLQQQLTHIQNIARTIGNEVLVARAIVTLGINWYLNPRICDQEEARIVILSGLMLLIQHGIHATAPQLLAAAQTLREREPSLGCQLALLIHMHPDTPEFIRKESQAFFDSDFCYDTFATGIPTDWSEAALQAHLKTIFDLDMPA